MRKFLMGLVAALIATAFMLVGTAPVMAATGSDGDSVTYELNLNISDAASSDSSFDYRSKSIVRSAVNADGQPVFYPVNHPSAHWRMANAKRCVTLKSYPNAKMIKRLYANPTIFKFRHGSKAETLFRKAAMSDKFVKKGSTDVMSASCFWLRPGTKFPDTVKDITDQVHGVGNSVKGNKPMLFEVAKATTHRSGESTDALVPVRRGQDFDGDGVIDDGDCGNKKPAVIEYNEGEYEYSDSDSYWWKDEGDVEARVHVGGSATIRQGSCSMTLYYDFFAQGKADYSVLVKGKTSIEAHGNAIEIISKQSAHADASANATASVKANLKAEFTGCDTQPTYQAPTASGQAKSCVKAGEQNGVITASGTNPNNVAAPGTLVVGGQTKQFTSVAAGQTVTWDFSGYAPGTYQGSFSLGAPVNKSATFSVTVDACPAPPVDVCPDIPGNQPPGTDCTPAMPAPRVSAPTINDVLVNNTRTITFTGKLAKGASGVASASANIGTVIGSNRINLVPDADGYFSVTFNYKAPGEAGSDSVTVVIDQSDGQSTSASTNQFDIRPIPPESE